MLAYLIVEQGEEEEDDDDNQSGSGNSLAELSSTPRASGTVSTDKDKHGDYKGAKDKERDVGHRALNTHNSTRRQRREKVEVRVREGGREWEGEMWRVVKIEW